MVSDNWKATQFRGEVRSIAEREFPASFNHDNGSICINRLYAEYLEAGEPSPKPWIRKKLAELFLWVDEPPKWVGRNQKWPFLNGTPMVFICQYAVPSTDVAINALTTEVVLYVFGARTPGDAGGVKMEYRVVEQYTDMP